MGSSRSQGGRVKTTTLPLTLPPRSFLVALGYVAGFFGLLPVVLWSVGERFDALLGLPRIDALFPAGFAAFAVGTSFMVVSMVGLSVRGRGLPMSHLPPQFLVTDGPYSYFRHPIYVGYTLSFSGLGLSAGSPGVGVGASGLLAVGAAIYALGFEEPRLVRRHGREFAVYARSVPLFPGSRVARDAAVRAWRTISPAFQWLADRPVMGRVGPTLWVTFGAFAGLGAFAATALIAFSLAPLIGSEHSSSLAVVATAATLFGGWLVARLYRLDRFVERPLEELRRVGFVSWGGYVGLIGSVLACAHVEKMPLLGVIDIVLPASLLTSAIGRIGCVSYGCCGGKPCKHGIRWRRPESRIVRELGEAGSVPRVPTQLLQCLHALATFAVVAALAGHSRPGAPALFTMILYSLGRFAIEFLRDEQRFGRFELTRGQIVAGVVFTLSTIGLFFLPAEGIAASFHVWPVSLLTLAAPLVSGMLAFVVCGVHLRNVGSF
jgi:phosphatidylglycerol:prolipoprotein diacylglycerol transferase